MSNALGAARALLTRSYLAVQNAALSARDALRIALREDDGPLAELARSRLHAMHRADLIADAERQEPTRASFARTARINLLRVEFLVGGEWYKDGEPSRYEAAIEHYERLCSVLRGHGDWAARNLDLHVEAIRLVDDRGCYAYWTAEGLPS